MGEVFEFRKATKKKAKLRLAITGPTGSGKTFTALKIARALVGPKGRIALIDTERESASLYSDVTEFDALDLAPPYTPDRYQGAMHAAARGEFDVLIIDSLSHAWFAEGGILDQKDRMDTRDKFGAWKTLTPQQNSLIDTILGYPGHVIVTMRSKMDYAVIEENGKKKIEKLGMAPVQRDGVEYEFTVIGDMDIHHTMHITKSRCASLADQHFRKPGEEIAQKLLAWLDDGVDVVAEALAEIEKASTFEEARMAGANVWRRLDDHARKQVHEAVEKRKAEFAAAPKVSA